MVKPLAFLSYCHENFDEVERLHDFLVKEAIQVWWDQDISPGSDWKHEIRQAMEKSDAFLLCLSKETEQRTTSGIYPEALDAITAYREYRPGETYVIPVRLSECTVPPVEIDGTRTLQRLQYIDLFGSKKTPNLRRLVDAIRDTIQNP